jgi:hypothetical protein
MDRIQDLYAMGVPRHKHGCEGQEFDGRPKHVQGHGGHGPGGAHGYRLQSSEPSGPGDAYGRESRKQFKARDLPTNIYGPRALAAGNLGGGGGGGWPEEGGEGGEGHGGGGEAWPREEHGEWAARGETGSAESQAARFERLYHDARRVSQRRREAGLKRNVRRRLCAAANRSRAEHGQARARFASLLLTASRYLSPTSEVARAFCPRGKGSCHFGVGHLAPDPRFYFVLLQGGVHGLFCVCAGGTEAPGGGGSRSREAFFHPAASHGPPQPEPVGPQRRLGQRPVRVREG